MQSTPRLVSLESLKKVATLLIFALALAPSAARSQVDEGPAAPRLFEGNLGEGGDWLHVLDAPTLSDRIYWYWDPDSGFSYQVQVATDAGFLNVVSDMDAIEQNWVAPNVEPGFYYFHVRATDAAGQTGPWSYAGTLDLVVDEESPKAQILSPVAGQAFSAGDTISIELRVSDDTVLRNARFTLNGAYAGTLPLATENFKLNPSFGEPRTVSFQVTAPKKSSALEIQAIVTDVMYKPAVATVTTGATSGGSASGSNGNGGGGNGGGSVNGNSRKPNGGGPDK
jgi:hypothetical protein